MSVGWVEYNNQEVKWTREDINTLERRGNPPLYLPYRRSTTIVQTNAGIDAECRHCTC